MEKRPAQTGALLRASMFISGYDIGKKQIDTGFREIFILLVLWSRVLV